MLSTRNTYGLYGNQTRLLTRRRKPKEFWEVLAGTATKSRDTSLAVREWTLRRVSHLAFGLWVLGVRRRLVGMGCARVLAICPGGGARGFHGRWAHTHSQRGQCAARYGNEMLRDSFGFVKLPWCMPYARETPPGGVQCQEVCSIQAPSPPRVVRADIAPSQWLIPVVYSRRHIFQLAGD